VPKKKTYCDKLKPLFELRKVKVNTLINDFKGANKQVWVNMITLIATKTEKEDTALTLKDIVVALKPKTWEKTKKDCKIIAMWYYSLLEWKCSSDLRFQPRADCKERNKMMSSAQATIFDNRDMVIYPKAKWCHTLSKPTC